MFTPDEIALKRRQLASLRDAHPQPAPHVAEVIARLERETSDVPQEAPGLADQLTAAQAIIAGLQQKLAATEADNAALREQLAAKPKTTPKRKR